MAWNEGEISRQTGGRAETTAGTMLSPRLRVTASLIIAVSIVSVTLLHFLTPLDQIVWHEIYQRLYYIPIIAAALLFGLRGGLAAALFTTVVYTPHIFLHWQHGHFDYSINQYAEIVIFNVVGGVMGWLGDRLRQARCAVEVADTGGDIGKEVMSKIFDPFFTTKEKGVGLGLSIAHKIVAQHGGKLAAENTLHGTVFRLILDRAENSTESE